ncbi:Hpt domain-containing protein [Flavobacterium sp.]|uniref:Hpt domain-containing protein n=1 Tax=Flavobacterium sp. TaxID=239 RepID=UPI00260FED36|nr:Hpt domain-containing protein [Flavobacterium sp.]MDG2431651.1 Hpt domain-containing protein [Flavobacterium sp.]
MEQPNIDYILKLSGGDNNFKIKMITIIKKELPLEIDAYNRSVAQKEFKVTAECVHKLKHKIAVLGLEKSYYIAHQYEDHLLKNSSEFQTEFESTLNLMQAFVNEL